MKELHANVLNSTYKEIYEILGHDDELLFKFFEQMSGQQINLPIHLYDATKVKELLSETGNSKNININDLAKEYGYSRRWI